MTQEERKERRLAYAREYYREYNKRPEVAERIRAYHKEYNQRPEVKESRKEYNQRPEVKERQRDYQREYYRKRRAALRAATEKTKEDPT